MRSFLLQLLFVLALAGPVSGALAQEPTADTSRAWADARLAAIPGWTARAESAVARVELARAYFAGAERFDVAFPDFDDAPLHRLGWIDAALAERTRREFERVRERGAPTPDLGDEEREAAWRAARDGALDGEDLAGSLERRLLLALRALAVDHPAIAGDGYAARRAELERSVATLDARARELALDEEQATARADVLLALSNAQRELTWLDKLAAAARWHATVPSAPSPLDREDIARLTDPLQAAAAADRLDRVRPLLSADEGALVDAGLAEWLRTDALPAARAALEKATSGGSPGPAVPREEIVAALSKRGEERIAQEAVLASLPAVGEAGVTSPRRQVAEERLALAKLREELAEARLAALDRRLQESQARDAAETARTRAETARRDAEAAASGATDDAGRRIAEILGQVADAEARAQEGWDTTQAAEDGFATREAEWTGSIRALEAELAAIAEASTGLLSDRRTRIRRAWATLHELLTDQREAAIEAMSALEAEQERKARERAAIADQRSALASADKYVDTLREGIDRLAAEQAIEAWEVALQSRSDAADQGLASAEDQRHRSFAALRQVKVMRAQLRPSVPSGERVDVDSLVSDIKLELRLLVPNLRTLVRRRLVAVMHLPELLTRPAELFSMLTRSFWMVLVLVVGFWMRARFPRLVEPMVMRLGRQERQLFQRDFRPLVQPVTVVAIAALDLVVLSLLLEPVRARLYELAILLVLVRIVILFRLADGIFRLSVAPASDRRPAALTVRSAAWPLVLRAERLLILWLLVGALVQYLLGEVVGAEALAWVAAQSFLIAFVGLSLFLLHLAEPHVREAVQADAPDGRMKTLLSGPGAKGFLLRAPRAAAGMVFLVGLRVWQVVQGNVDEGSLAGRILNVVNRRRLTNREEVVACEKLPPEVGQRLWGPVTAASANLLYPSIIERADAAVAGWTEDESRGLILLVGDRGQGKRVLVKDWTTRAASTAGLVLRTARLGTRLLDESRLFGTVARELDLPACADESAFQEALKELPPSLIVLEDLEQAFLRRVGGFGALRALFRALNASCDRHFWLLSMHGPSWRLLERLGTVVNPNSFREVIELPRLSGAELQKFLIGRTEEQGFAPDFGPLSSSTAAGQPRAEAERTAEAYFRLLAEASGGNPRIAAWLWVSSLTPAPGQTFETTDPEGPPIKLRVRLPEVISDPTLPPLSDPALLTLAAVRVHGGLTVREIVAANNMEQDLVQGTVQVLDNLGLLENVGGSFRIEMNVLVSITRLLRRRHFVYGKDVS